MPILTEPDRDFIDSVDAASGRRAGREVELDLRGVAMPLPYLQVRRGLMELAPDQQLLVATTDPEALRGFPVLARRCGHQLVEQHTVDSAHLFLFRRR